MRRLGLRAAQKCLNLIKGGGGVKPCGVVLAATNLGVLRVLLRHLGRSALLLQLGGQQAYNVKAAPGRQSCKLLRAAGGGLGRSALLLLRLLLLLQVGRGHLARVGRRSRLRTHFSGTRRIRAIASRKRALRARAPAVWLLLRCRVLLGLDRGVHVGGLG